MLTDLAQTPDVSTSPVVVYVTMAAAVLAGVITVSDRVGELLEKLGPVGRWFEKRRARKLKRARDATDVRLTDQDKQIAYLEEQLDEVRRQNKIMQENTWRLLGWATRNYVKAHKQGVEIEPPPEMIPVEGRMAEPPPGGQT